MRILFLSQWFPVPVNNGSKLRVYNLLQALSQHHDVTLLSFADQPDIHLTAVLKQSLCVDVQVVPWREFDPRSRRARLGFFHSRPRFLTDTYSTELDILIRQSLSKDKYDLVIASQLMMASYHTSFQGIPAVFEELELGLFHDNALYANNLRKRIRLGLTWLKLQKYLEQVLGVFHSCTVVSEREQQLFVNSFPKHRTKVNVVPNCITVADYQNLKIQPVPNQLVFSGSFRYFANYEAMQWFVGEVFPKILNQLPDTRLIITGDHSNLPLPALTNVTLTGHVEDIKALIASSWVSLAPLLSGGGTRMKILEAMALATPIVSTSKGAEGLNARPDFHLLVADSAVEFANHVINVLKSKTLHDKLAANSLQFVREHYDWKVAMPRFLAMVENAARGESVSR